MIPYVLIQILAHLVIGILGWAIKDKQQYALVSGFIQRPQKEQEELIKNGYPQKTGAVLFYTAIISGALLPFVLIWESFMFIQLGVFLFLLIGGMFYVSKYDTKKGRKKSRWISGIVFVVLVIILVGLPLFNYGGYDMTIQEDKLEITGSYGDIYSYSELSNLQLLDEMPTVEIRTNGLGLPHLSKGHFKVKDYGSSKLFIYHDNPPYIYFETSDKPVFINNEDPAITKQWYEALTEKIQ